MGKGVMRRKWGNRGSLQSTLLISTQITVMHCLHSGCSAMEMLYTEIGFLHIVLHKLCIRVTSMLQCKRAVHHSLICTFSKYLHCSPKRGSQCYKGDINKKNTVKRKPERLIHRNPNIHCVRTLHCECKKGGWGEIEGSRPSLNLWTTTTSSLNLLQPTQSLPSPPYLLPQSQSRSQTQPWPPFIQRIATKETTTTSSPQSPITSGFCTSL